MQALKQDIESYIKTNWATTPIFWYGTNFNAKGLSSYIEVKALPNPRNIMDLTQTDTKVGIFLEVYAYAETNTESIGMLDDIATLMDTSGFKKDSTSTYAPGYQENGIWFNTIRMNVFDYI